MSDLKNGESTYFRLLRTFSKPGIFMKRSFEQINKLKDKIINQSILVAFVVGLVTFLLSLTGLDNESNRIFIFSDLLVVVVFGFVYFTRQSIPAKTKSLFALTALMLFMISNTLKHGAFGYTSIVVVVPFFANMFFSLKKAFGFLIFFLMIYGLIGFFIVTGNWEIISEVNIRNMMPEVWITKTLIVGSIGAIILIITHQFNNTFEKLIQNLNEKNKDLSQREANLKSIFDGSENVVGLFDSDKLLLQFNWAFEKLAREKLGIPLKKGIHLVKETVGDIATNLEDGLNSALDGKKFYRTIDFVDTSKQQYYLLSFNPIYHENEVTGIVMFAQDISSLKQAQHELKVYNEKLEELVAERTKKLEQTNNELLENNALLEEQRIQLESTVDELRKTQQQLVESEKMASLGVMSAGIAHEINNPLNFIQGGVFGLRDEVEEFDNQSIANRINPYLKIIKDGVRRATEIVKSLSHFSRQTTRIDETCDLHQIIDNCLSILKSSLKDKVEVARNYTKNNRPVQGNEGKLHQVFVNLISNAEQAIEQRGTLEISTEMTEEKAIVRLIDDGRGISEDNLTKIMDPFFTTKAPGQGTGLGLSITKKIIKEHQGELKVSSKLNQGTIFVVELPITPAT